MVVEGSLIRFNREIEKLNKHFEELANIFRRYKPKYKTEEYIMDHAPEYYLNTKSD